MINTDIIKAFIADNRFYDELQNSGTKINSTNYPIVGEILKNQTRLEMCKICPGYNNCRTKAEAGSWTKQDKDFCDDIMYDIVDGLSDLSIDELSKEFANYFLGEYQERKGQNT